MTKPRRVSLKFGPTLTVKHENILFSHGFVRFARKSGSYVIFEKVFVKTPETDLEAFGVPEAIQKELTKRLYRVVDSYVDPYSNIPVIRAQCVTLARHLPANQEAWVMRWIVDTIDTEHFAPPWENEDHQPVLGFC